MEISRKQLATIVLLIALSFSSIGWALHEGYQHFDPHINVQMEVVKGEASGASATLYSGNVITDIGEYYIKNASLTLDGNTSQWAISVSNDGSASSSWTELPAEVAANGFTRTGNETYCWTNSGDEAFNVTVTFTATGTQQLQTAGLQWDDTASSNNNLFAAADFTQTTFESSDTLTVTWIVTFNAN